MSVEGQVRFRAGQYGLNCSMRTFSGSESQRSLRFTTYNRTDICIDGNILALSYALSYALSSLSLTIAKMTNGRRVVGMGLSLLGGLMSGGWE